MNRSEAHTAAQNYIEVHSSYIARFEDAWDRAIEGLETTQTDGIIHPVWNALTPEQTIEVFQNFWENLPDNGTIHRMGFGELCDIAENLFGFDDDEPAE